VADQMREPPRGQRCSGTSWWVHLDAVGGWVAVTLDRYVTGAERRKSKSKRIKKVFGVWLAREPFTTPTGVLTPFIGIVDNGEPKWRPR